MEGQEKESQTAEKFIPEVTLDVSKLPSRGVPYPEGSTLSYRTYTFGEVQKASGSNYDIKDSIKLAMSGITCSFDKQSLTVTDCLYVGILRKTSSMSGLDFEVPFRCENCGETDKGRFTHTDISFRDLPDEVTELPIEVDLLDRTFEFTPMTVKQFIELHGGRYDNVLKEGKVDRVSIYASMVRNADFKDVYDFLYKLDDPDAIEDIAEVDRLMRHDMNPLEGKCKQDGCEHITKIKLEGREALLLPFRKRVKSDRTRIRIGSTPKSERA